MKFDTEKFKATNFVDRVKHVPVPGLRPFFKTCEGDEEDAAPVWTVRGLTGIESARTRQAVADSENLEAIIQAIGTGAMKDKVDAIRKMAGLQDADDIPQDLVSRYSMLTQASVDPICDYPLAIRLAENRPEEFYLLTNTILSLTSGGRLGE